MNCTGIDLSPLNLDLKFSVEHLKENLHLIIVIIVYKMRMLFILSFVSFFKILQLAYPNYVYCWVFIINNFDLFVHVMKYMDYSRDGRK